MNPGDYTDLVIQAMRALLKLVPAGGLKNLEEVRQEMDEMISPEYEPYFLANAALHLLAECERCGRCCQEEKTIAVTIEDCRRIARHLGLSQKKFMMDYTRPHELKEEMVGSARALRKEEGYACPFYDQDLPGCRIHPVKPQVCRAAFYLSKTNLLLCEEQKEIRAIPGCPADAKLRERIAEFVLRLDGDPGEQEELKAAFSFRQPEAKASRMLLRLKGMEIYFGRERSEKLARRLGLARVPEDGEMRRAAWLYAAANAILINYK
jgi:Fe-S-cluster containining protein